MKLKSLLASAVVVAGATFLSLPAPSFAAENVFRFANQSDLKSLDPYALSETFSLAMIGSMYEGLVARDPDLKLVPALAESWDVSEDARIWTFHLRKGVTFKMVRHSLQTTSFSPPIAFARRAPTSRAAFPPTPFSPRSMTTLLP